MTVTLPSKLGRHLSHLVEDATVLSMDVQPFGFGVAVRTPDCRRLQVQCYLQGDEGLDVLVFENGRMLEWTRVKPEPKQEAV